MKKEPNKYPCPNCNVEFTAAQARLNNKSCPHCNVPVEARRNRHKEHRGFYYTFVLSDRPPDKTKTIESPKVPPKKKKSRGRLLSRPGERPEIYQIGEERKYEVVYRDQIITGWLYCPGCWHKMFQNTRAISPVHLEQEHKCRRQECKALVKFIFKRSMSLST